MASRAGGVVQDQNLNIHFNETSVGWKTNVSKAPRKGVLGGRTPLGDLSNSLKPSLNQASKKQNSSIFSFTEKEIGASQNALDATKNRSTCKKASGKAHTTGRKPLSDISNSGKQNRNEGSKRSYNAKLSVVAEEPIDANAIAGEQFLHNHEECIKVQSRVMNLDQFLQMIGLDNDIIKQHANTVSIKAESPPRQHLELEEMTEELIEEEFWNDKLWSCKLDSPPPCRTPKSPKHYMNSDYNFALLESP
ncbi:uncharacterized protein LOC8277110 isoform X2 [Ricinus communis]|uniref:uncharacterized protein LOC8277110 isoform X2 n=1 Tax=Ricinus communis TaxID=3988 RepID=UPI000772B478|nr:uncharacterized protein LOC8277110 isoform X2 [Ricinus communis]|eukprot:XP_015571176.1 uncharacterized protein LOC8277110 isoform X2 [Ricinus communis]